uniref:Integrase n=1 Tax=Haemonchus placei TaxID=6290 RepID=A0A0N4VYR3_HAEPC
LPCFILHLDGLIMECKILRWRSETTERFLVYLYGFSGHTTISKNTG